MARKKKRKINSKLITILLVLSIPVIFIMAIAVDSRRPFLPRFIHEMLGRDPVMLIEEAEKELVQLEDYYKQIVDERRAIEDPKEAAEKWDQVFEEDFAPRARKVYDVILDGSRFSKGDIELQIEAKKLTARFHLILDRYYGGAVEAWNSITKLDVNNYYAWNNKADFYLDVVDVVYNSKNIEDLRDAARNLKQIKPEDSKGYTYELLASIYELKAQLSSNSLALESEAVKTLGELKEKFPGDVVVAKCAAMLYGYQASQSESYERKKSLFEKAGQELKASIEANPDSAEAVLNYCDYFLRDMMSMFTSEYTKTDNLALKKQFSEELSGFIDSAKGEYAAFLLKFPNDAELKVSMARDLLVAGSTDYQKVEDLLKEALEYEPDNLMWLSWTGKILYISAMNSAEAEDKYVEARKYLRQAYYGFNDIVMTRADGPRIKGTLYAETMPLLALADAKLADKVEDAKDELNELYLDFAEDLGKDVAVTKAIEGLLALAEDKDQEAVQKLYAAAKSDDFSQINKMFAAEVYWKLFELLKDTQYKDIAMHYGSMSFRSRGSSASDFIELLDTQLSSKGKKISEELINHIGLYIDNYSGDVETIDKIRLYYAQALLSYGDKEKAKEVLGQINDGQGIIYDLMKCQVMTDANERLLAIEELAKKYPGDPDIVNYLLNVYNGRMREDESYLAKARALLARAVTAAPDNVGFLQNQKRLSEPDPFSITPERQKELQLEVIEAVNDPYQQAMMYGSYYAAVTSMSSRSGDDESARAESEKAVNYFEKAAQLKPDSTEPLSSIFMIYVMLEDFEKAQNIVNRISEIDSQAGKFAGIDLMVAKNENEKAMSLLTSLLEESPLSSQGHLLLSKVYSNMGRNSEAKAELMISLEQNSFDSNVIEEYLKKLHESNLAVGLDKIGINKIQDTIILTERLISLEPKNVQAAISFIQYAPLLASYLDQQVSSSNMEGDSRQAVLDNISNIEVKVLYFVNLLVSNAHHDENIYLISIQALQRMRDLGVLKEKVGKYNDIMAQIYEAALAEFPDSAVVMSYYELFLRGSTGKSGMGLEKLQNLVSNSTGQEKISAVIALANFYYQDGSRDKAVELLTREIAASEDLDFKQMMRRLLASKYVEAGDFASAIEIYEQQRKEKDSDDLMTLHIETMMDGGYSDDAEALLDKMEQKYPDDHKVYLLRAKNSLRETDYGKALEYIDKALQISPDNSAGLRLKAQALFFMDKYDEAKESIEALRKVSGNNPNVGRALLSQIYWRNNQFDAAILELRKGLEVEPGNVQLNAFLVDYLKARKRWNELTSYYESRIKSSPDNLVLYAQYASIMDSWALDLSSQGDLAAAGQKVEAALEKVNDALQMAAEKKLPSLPLFASRISLLLRLGRQETVIEDLKANPEAVKNSPSLSLKLVEALSKNGQKEAAFDSLTQLIDSIPADYLTEDFLESVIRVMSPDDLISWVDSTIENHQKKGFLYLVKALAYRFNGQMDQFFSIAEKALAASADNVDWQILAKSKMAITYIQTGEYEKAVVIYRDIVDVVENEKDGRVSYLLLNNFAYALLSAGGSDKEALDIATRAYSLARLEPMVLDTYGMALRQNKQYDQAYKIAKKAIQETQRKNQVVPVEFEYHMAQIMNDLGLKEEALESLEKVLERARASRSSSDQALVEDIEALLSKLKQ